MDENRSYSRITFTVSEDVHTKVLGITSCTISLARRSWVSLRNEKRKPTTTASSPRLAKSSAAARTSSSLSGTSTAPLGGLNRSVTGMRLRRLTKGFDCQGTSNWRLKLCGRLCRAMCRMSRNPLVVSMPTSAPSRSMTMFVATVVPWKRTSIRPRLHPCEPTDLKDARHHPLRLVVRRAGHLGDHDLLIAAVRVGAGALQHDVGEGAADIYAHSYHRFIPSYGVGRPGDLARRRVARSIGTLMRHRARWSPARGSSAGRRDRPPQPRGRRCCRDGSRAAPCCRPPARPRH